MIRLLLLLLLAAPALAETKTVSWEPAINDTLGIPLPVGYVWTAVNQYQLGCPATGAPIAGKAVISLPGVPQSAAFEVAAGTCSCFEVVTWVWSWEPGQSLSAPVAVEACAPMTTCGGCHAG